MDKQLSRLVEHYNLKIDIEESKPGFVKISVKINEEDKNPLSITCKNDEIIKTVTLAKLIDQKLSIERSLYLKRDIKETLLG